MCSPSFRFSPLGNLKLFACQQIPAGARAIARVGSAKHEHDVARRSRPQSLWIRALASRDNDAHLGLKAGSSEARYLGLGETCGAPEAGEVTALGVTALGKAWKYSGRGFYHVGHLLTGRRVAPGRPGTTGDQTRTARDALHCGPGSYTAKRQMASEQGGSKGGARASDPPVDGGEQDWRTGRSACCRRRAAQNSGLLLGTAIVLLALAQFDTP